MESISQILTGCMSVNSTRVFLQNVSWKRMRDGEGTMRKKNRRFQGGQEGERQEVRQQRGRAERGRARAPQQRAVGTAGECAGASLQGKDELQIQAQPQP